MSTYVLPKEATPTGGSANRCGPYRLSVIIPTFNERDNVAPMVSAVSAALTGVKFEIIFVDDDSTDGTREAIAEVSQTNPNVRAVHRIGRRGLSTAIVEGALSSQAPYFAVIDADLQHDERILPQMLSALENDLADLVVGSRYTSGGSLGDWDSKRAQLSAWGTNLAHLITKVKVSDPMSGFFSMSRPAFYSAVRNLSGQGYKILVDICASTKQPLRIIEIPYEFRTRQAGESKLDALVSWEYLMLLADKLVGHIVPARFISFVFIGGLGTFVHMAILSALIASQLVGFLASQTIATGIAMIFNFFVNNTLTYRDRRLTGLQALSKGLASFMAVCSIGAFANVGIASYLYSDQHYIWWSAGLAGILVGAVWNYATTSLITWRVR